MLLIAKAEEEVNKNEISDKKKYMNQRPEKKQKKKNKNKKRRRKNEEEEEKKEEEEQEKKKMKKNKKRRRKRKILYGKIPYGNVTDALRWLLIMIANELQCQTTATTALLTMTMLTTTLM